MRAFVATFLLLLLSFQPLAGAALCLRHQAAQAGAACEAGMEMGSDDEMPPKSHDCGSELACAVPTPVVGGTPVAFSLTPHLLLSRSRPLVEHRPEVPAAPFFRPPIA